MAGMFLTGDATFASFGVATMTVVAVAMLGSLTVLPALLSKLGDNVDRGRVPFVHRLRRDDGEGRIWGAIIDRVLRRPGRVGGAGRRAAGRTRGPGASSCSTAQPSIDTLPAEVPDDATTASRRHSPATENAADVVIKAAERRGAGRAGGDRPSSSGARSQPAS